MASRWCVSSLLESDGPTLITALPQQISFAKTASDAVVRKLDEAGFDSHLETRKEHKRPWTPAVYRVKDAGLTPALAL